MKRLDKLQINSEKLMKNEELIALKGGIELEATSFNCYEGGYQGCITLDTCDEITALGICQQFYESNGLDYNCGIWYAYCDYWH